MSARFNVERWLLAIFATGVLHIAIAAADEPVVALSRKIDALIAARLQQENIPASPRADDAEFLRRVTIDLTGCVPTAREAAEFLDDAQPDKRSRLVEQLLASPGYGRHFADLWCNLMIDEEILFTQIRRPSTEELHGWLAAQFQRNRPWSELVRDLLVAEGPLEKNPQAVFYQLNGDQSLTPQPGLLARSAARLFLGENLQCAECHDHPFRETTQQDYWGMAAFFARLSIASEETGKLNEKGKKESITIVREAPAGFVIRSNNLGDRKVLDQPAIAIPGTAFKNTGYVVAAKLLGEATPTPAMDKPLRPVLADWLTSTSNKRFARTAANRLWSQIMGRGLVMPVDDLYEDHAPTHPTLLELLASEYAGCGFDQQRMIRAMVLSETYQRSSAAVAGNELEDPLYARMSVRPLSAETLLASLCTVLETDENALFALEREADKRNQHEKNPWDSTPRIRFVEQFKTPENDPAALDHGIPQVLRRINDPLFQSGGKVAARLVKEKVETPPAVEQLYLATLSRRPTSDEQAEAQAFVNAQPDAGTGYARLLWLLLSQSEFLLNH